MAAHRFFYGGSTLLLEIVLATALVAIARKVIILDYKALNPEYIYATASVVLAMSIGYWLVVVRRNKEPS